MTTKLVSKTQEAIQVIALKAKEDPKCKFTSLVHLLTEDFLKECFRELKRRYLYSCPTLISVHSP
jgi:hypothetical protein